MVDLILSVQTRKEPFSPPLNNLHKTSLKKEENWSTMRHIFATKFCDGGAMDGNLRLLCLWISWGWELAWIGCSVRSSRRWRCDVTPVNTNTLNHHGTSIAPFHQYWRKKLFIYVCKLLNICKYQRFPSKCFIISTGLLFSSAWRSSPSLWWSLHLQGPGARWRKDGEL